MNIKERFNDAIEYFSMTDNLFGVQICKLGYPAENKSIPTAAIAWDDRRKCINFLFNPDFAKDLTDEEFRFIIAHEAIHLLNSHIVIFNDKINELKKFGKTNSDIMQYLKKLNIAADCVVNDSLVNLYGFNKIMEDKIFYGQKVIEKDAHDLTVMDVFYLMKDAKEGEQGDEGQSGQGGGQGLADDHSSWGSLFDSNGSLKKEVKESIKNFIDNNLENSKLTDEQLENIEKIKKDFDKHNPDMATGTQAGNMKVGAYRAIDNLSKIAVNWNKVLYRMLKKIKPEDSWTKVNKKLISQYPNIILPSSIDGEREDIFIAIDSSGSIDYNALSLFLSVVRNIPKNFKVKCISFDTQCYEFDIHSKENPKGGGGTNFSIIEDWINANMKKYPKAVIVLTDGAGSEVNPKYPERWGWMLCAGCETTYCKDMKKFYVKDLLK